MERDELVALRKRLGLKSISLARMAAIERTRYSLWECGHVSLTADELERVANCVAQELTLIKHPKPRGNSDSA